MINSLIIYLITKIKFTILLQSEPFTINDRATIAFFHKMEIQNQINSTKSILNNHHKKFVKYLLFFYFMLNKCFYFSHHIVQEKTLIYILTDDYFHKKTKSN